MRHTQCNPFYIRAIIAAVCPPRYERPLFRRRVTVCDCVTSTRGLGSNETRTCWRHTQWAEIDGVGFPSRPPRSTVESSPEPVSHDTEQIDTYSLGLAGIAKAVLS